MRKRVVRRETSSTRAHRGLRGCFKLHQVPPPPLSNPKRNTKDKNRKNLDSYTVL